MASIRKYNDGYRAEVYVSGQRKSKTCRTKREAVAWSYQTEEALRRPPAETQTLRKALERWRDEIAPKRRGERWECIRIDAWLRDPAMPCCTPLREATPEQFGRLALAHGARPGVRFGVVPDGRLGDFERFSVQVLSPRPLLLR